MKNKGLTIAYTGDGKGKTTAAIGLAFRALGYNKKIKIIQFVKGSRETGEKLFAERIDGIDIESMGLGFVGMANDQKDILSHRSAAAVAINRAEEALTSKNDLLVLDEVFVAVELGLIKEKTIIELLKKKTDHQTIVLTGRGATQKLLDLCDLVTEMTNIKHPFDIGVEALKSIDY